MDWQTGANIATIAAAVTGTPLLVMGFLDYRKRTKEYQKSIEDDRNQQKLHRANFFNQLRLKFNDNARFIEICSLLDDEDPGLLEVPFANKRQFIGFFEEVSLMLNSGLIGVDVAHYMFGYYAIKCWGSERFWVGIGQTNMYWAEFGKFAVLMYNQEQVFDRKHKLEF